MRAGLTGAAVAATLISAAATGVSTAPAAEGSRFRPAVAGNLGVVATESPAAARIGRGVLERGGNAVDAAVATTFALGVARPQSCGIGGGGFLVYRGADGRAAALDYRETAPARFRPATLQGEGLHEGFTGHLTVGVPGTVAGMDAALRRFGTISLGRAVAPAERLARQGFRVPASLSAAMADNADRLKLFPAAARQYLVNGSTPYSAGSRLRQPRLAATLRSIGRAGARAFYRGTTARLIVADMKETRKEPLPGDAALLTKQDLARYRAKWRRPLRGRFRGQGIVAMPPPTSGGIALVQMLNVLEGYNLRRLGMSSAASLHRIIEAQKLAFADRGEYVADPDFVKVPTAKLISQGYAKRRRALIDPAHAGSYEPGLGAFEGSPAAKTVELHHAGTTTHLSVIDSAGNAVALTCTIEQEFGSAVVAPRTGFLLNNEMTDFGDPGTANEARGGKRPRSSMSPTIVVSNSRPLVVTGGAGGSRIIMGALFAVLNRIEFGLDLAQAVDAERLDAQAAPEAPILVEESRLAPGVLSELQARGHIFTAEGEYAERPRVQAAGFAKPRGVRKLAVSDPRTDAGSLTQRRR